MMSLGIANRGGLAAFSDTHLLDGSGADDFHADNALRGWLIEHRYDDIVGAGDIFELLQTRLGMSWPWRKRSLKRLREQIARIEKAHPKATEAIKRYVKVLVVGNHDDALRRLPEGRYGNAQIVRGPYFHEPTRTLLDHWHRFDSFNGGRLAAIGTTAAWLAGLLERPVDRDVDLWLSAWAKEMLGYGRYGDPGRYADEARLYMAANYPAADLFVGGHTHVHSLPMLETANCGHWTGAPEEVRRRVNEATCYIVIEEE